MPISDKEIEDVLQKYGRKLEKQVRPEDVVRYKPSSEFSKEYLVFKREFLTKRLSWYEKSCKNSYKILKVKIDINNKKISYKSIPLSIC